MIMSPVIQKLRNKIKNHLLSGTSAPPAAHALPKMEQMEPRLLMSGDLVISELMSNNDRTIADEDGDFSDWLELYNAGDSPLDTAGYHLTDDNLILNKWTLPATTLQPGDRLLVFASGKNRAISGNELHTNFQLSANGEFLALVNPDNTTIKQSFDPFPALDNDISFGIEQDINQISLIDANSTANLFIPTDASLADTWTSPAFDDASWQSVNAAFGFDLNPSQGLISYYNFDGQVLDHSSNANHGTLNGPAFAADVPPQLATGMSLDFDGLDDYVDLNAHIADVAALDSGTISVWFKTSGTGTHVLLAASDKDDPSSEIRFFIEGNVLKYDIRNDGNVAGQLVTGTVNDNTWHHAAVAVDNGNATLYLDGNPIVSGLEGYFNSVFGLDTMGIGRNVDSSGNQWQFDGLMDDMAIWSQPLNATQIANLASGTSPLAISGINNLIESDISTEMHNQNASAYARYEFDLASLPVNAELSLNVNYDDGFVAYLNGTEVARRNAPASLTYDASATLENPTQNVAAGETINLSAFAGDLLLGQNVLAIHALNLNANDNDFLFSAELTATEITGETSKFFTTPTPGQPNNQGVLGFVGDTSFSVDRGYFDSAFDVEITSSTLDAQIFYTTNGSAPSPTNGTLYQGPINIATTTTLRAAAFKTGHQPSNVDTQTYLFLADVILQNNTPAGFPTDWGTHDNFNDGGQFLAVADYEMDPNVVNDPRYANTIIDDLKSLPALSIVIDIDDMFDPTTGIYSNPLNSGSDWERAASLEWFNTDGSEEFQVDAGIRTQGGASRRPWKTPKHPFRVLFKSEYGDSKLNFPLFGNDHVDQFDTLVLRAGFNDGWGIDALSQADDAVFIRDQVMRDLYANMGQESADGRYAHLYINGIYWGLYDVSERPDASFQEEHFGGDKENYDVVKHLNNGTGYEVVDGDNTAWLQAMAIANAGVTDEASFNQLAELIDLESLSDYMLLNIYSGTQDWIPNNWYAARERTEGAKWKFFIWDAERSFESTTLNVTGENANNTPARLFTQLRQNDTFNLRFADRVQKHMFGDGALTTENLQATMQLRIDEVERAVVAESARWGDAQKEPPFTLDDDWLPRINTYMNVFFENRHGNVIAQLKALGLYPALESPVFSQDGGQVPLGYELTITATAPANTGGGTGNPNDPVTLGHWEFNEQAAGNNASTATGAILDASGNNFHATVSPTLEYVAGDPNHPADTTGLQFGADSDFLEVLNTANEFNIDSSTSFTIETLINTTSSSVGAIAAKQLSSSTTGEWWWRINGGRSQFLVDNGPTQNNVHGSINVTDGQWHHLAVMYDADSSVLRAYVDYQLDAEVPVTISGTFGNSGNLNIGRFQADSRHFEGIMDYVRISQGALTPDQFIDSTIDPPDPEPDPEQDITTIYYTLDGTDPKANDGSVNPNAILYGTVSSSIILEKGESWSYLDDGSNQMQAWHNPGFDFSTWETGLAPLGYGGDGEVTTIDFGTDIQNKHTTAYFLKTLNLSDASDINALTMNLLYDDGAIVYINGNEVARTNMPQDPVDYTTFAQGIVTTENEGQYISFRVDPSLLIDGDNLIAVEVHQATLHSSDTIMDMELVASMNTGDPIIINERTPVNARVKFGDDWSPLNAAEFFVHDPASSSNLRITEINYNPVDPTPDEALNIPGVDNDDFEFIELTNIGQSIIDLTGVKFTDGITFDFSGSNVTTLAPGEHVVVVRSASAALSRHASLAQLRVAGEYDGGLNNGGETLQLLDKDGAIIQSFTYDDANGWPGRADGNGSSLEVIDVNGDYNDADNWRSSYEYHGSPGRAGAGPRNDIVINEVLAHTDEPDLDAIELHNTTNDPVDVSNWWLSDSNNNYQRFQIPANTIIQGNSYIVFDAADFNPTPLNPGPNDFGLSSLGDDVWLLEGDLSGELVGFVDHVEFGASLNGVSFGRFPNGTGDLYPMSNVTLTAHNATPRIGDVIISEIMYAPVDPNIVGITANDMEFIEIYNTTGTTVNLDDWAIDGIGYTFAPGAQIAPSQTKVIVSFNPDTAPDKLAAFRTVYGIDETVDIVGPFTGRIDNSGEKLTLQRADDPPAEDPTTIPLVIEDQADYESDSPWPVSPATGADALHRVAVDSFGNDPASWTALAPTPGSVDLDVCGLGDFDCDGDIDADDIDSLRDAINANSTDAKFDVNGDNVVDELDFNYQIEDILDTAFGDANLDKKVNIQDLALLASNFNGSAGWASGNFNTDSLINIQDLALLASRFNYDNTGGAAASESLSDSDSSTSNGALVLSTDDADDSDTHQWSHIGNILDETDTVNLV